MCRTLGCLLSVTSYSDQTAPRLCRVNDSVNHVAGRRFEDGNDPTLRFRQAHGLRHRHGSGSTLLLSGGVLRPYGIR